MKEFVNQITAWELLIIFICLYLIGNLVILIRGINFNDKSKHPLDLFVTGVVLLLIGGPLVIWSAIKKKH